MEIKKQLIPDGRTNKPGKDQCPRCITLHNTDNTTPKATAEAHARYLLRGSCGRQASWHYTVDDKDIYQHLRDDEQGWHAGDGCGQGNSASIGIEICMYAKMDTERCWRNAAWLVAHLLNKHKLPLERVVPHKKWSGKNCPSQILPHWDKFIGMVREEMRHKQAPCPKPIPIVMEGKAICTGKLVNGNTIAPVRPIVEALGAKVGWDGKCATANGNPIVGSTTLNDVAHAPVRAIIDACKPRIDHDKNKGEIVINR